jgi:hypothetical protein
LRELGQAGREEVGGARFSRQARVQCNVVVTFILTKDKLVSQQIGIPGIVRNGVIVPQSSQPIPEGTHVEIRLEPGEVPASLKSEIEAWDRASDESWTWIDSLEADEQ